MDLHLAIQRYEEQRRNARHRGIEWRFTFKTWVEFWGDDFEKRGVGPDKLCMQRIGDVGPYSPENCIKGYPLQNARTVGDRRLAANSSNRSLAHQRNLDAANMHFNPPRDELDEDQLEIARMFGIRRTYTWNNDA